jgi:hypothetical protein
LLTTSCQNWLIKECKQFTKELTEQTQNISQSMKDQTTLHEPGIASTVKEFLANKIRGKLMNSSGPKDFISFSAFVHDTSLNDLFFSNISAEWDMFELQFDKIKPPSQAEITFFATKKLMNIIIQPKDFLSNCRLAHVYMLNYFYLPVTLMDALDIRGTCPNNIMY